MKHKAGDVINGTLLVRLFPSIAGKGYGEFKCKFCSELFSAWLSNVCNKNKNVSCGCKRGARVKHGCALSGNPTPEYRLWNLIKDRCLNPKSKAYPSYGGRGIKMCDRWLNSFDDFRADIGKRPSRYYSLDRYPNNDGDYEPGNIRWATMKQQTRNRRSNVLITYNGKTKPLIEWTEQLGLPYESIRMKIVNKRWSVSDAFNTPYGKKKVKSNFIPHAFGVIAV